MCCKAIRTGPTPSPSRWTAGSSCRALATRRSAYGMRPRAPSSVCCKGKKSLYGFSPFPPVVNTSLPIVESALLDCQCSHHIFATRSRITNGGEELLYLHPDHQDSFGIVSGSIRHFHGPSFICPEVGCIKREPYTAVCIGEHLPGRRLP
jgi:hypothetical protein